jgi:tetratricopeptide (TPR) repeat protein
MFTPGGTAEGAARARKRLGDAGGGLHAAMARGIHDELHGQPRTAADAFVAAADAASRSTDPDAPLLGWFATHEILALRGSVRGLYDRHKDTVARLVARPGRLGWRAVAELVEWSASEAFDRAEAAGSEQEVERRFGCTRAIRIAGPFGSGAARDRRESFPAETAPWLPVWPANARRGTEPRVLRTEKHRCLVAASEKTADGVFYAETWLTTPADRDVILAAQGAVALWVDDVPVMARDLRNFGVWQRFGGSARLGAGRHRVLARLMSDSTSLRVLNLDGTAAGLPTDTGGASPYGIARAEILADPNPLTRVLDPKAPPSAILAAIASHVAHAESMDDVASWLAEPLVTPADAAPGALDFAARYTEQDPILTDESRRKITKELHTRAAKADPGLWLSRAWLTLEQGEQRGLVDVVEPMRALAAEFEGTPDVLLGLARVYGKLGWRAERLRTLADVSTRFPDHVPALLGYLAALEDDGALSDADAVASRIAKLDPNAEIALDRALARRDWKAAIAELDRIGKRRPERKDIAQRVAAVLLRAGNPQAAADQLSKALAKNPEDAGARFRLADMAFAGGDGTALRRALAETIQQGGKGKELREAVELLEGASFLEPYRIDGKKVIREFEAWEQGGKHMNGTAARVLDYAVTWIHPDGSSEMLEHEILKIQSQEAINKEAEQKPPDGLVLRFRVVKKDGAVLEPEVVAGKPTRTMPHLEVGDYIEIEHITASGSEGGRGRRYQGPHWFFREADKGYWRSEFVAVTPKDRDVEIETRGTVPSPVVSERGMFVERRWRVDESPPAPEEPDSPPPGEFLPSVRVGWGVTLDEALARFVDATSDEIPRDPRLVRRANEIAGGAKERDERARRAYEYVTTQIEDGPEGDGRKVLTGRSGSRQAAFYHLLRLLDVPVRFALVRNRLAMPPVGKMSEVESWDSVVMAVDTERGPRRLTVRDKFAPYGYVPADLRGQPAILLVPGTPRTTIGTEGAGDAVVIEGKADVRDDGSATVKLVQTYTGKLGIGLRNVFDKIPERGRDDFVETRLLGRNLPGARLKGVSLSNQKDPTKPFVVEIQAEVSQLLREDGGRAVLKPIFPMHLAQLATLPERQTPLLIGSATRLEIRFSIAFPERYRLPASLPRGELRDHDRSVTVKDAVEGHAIRLDRVVDIPAGRVQPGADYKAFLGFVQKADGLTESEILVGR